MKSLFRIIRRYSLSAGLIIIAILFTNFFVLVYAGYKANGQRDYLYYARQTMEQIGSEMQAADGEYALSDHGEELLADSGFLWAMALNMDGAVVWEWKLPPEIPKSYTLSDVASFTRWYLEDYPVRVWKYGELLLVFGSNPELEARYSEVFSLKVIRNIPLYLKLFVIANFAVILVFIFCYGYRFYHSLKPVAEGIEKLSRQEAVQLKEKGMAGELSAKLNLTSRILEEQHQKLNQRDQARTEWISGVSHDIRTPLALIVGYAERLAEEASLREEEKMLAQGIQRQSMVISQLIRDLNLTSKLAYRAQPLHKTMCSPALLLRECVTEIYNESADSGYDIEVYISDEAEQIKLPADIGLVKRALRNLLGNSMRHNPNGCRIKVLMRAHPGTIGCLICDTGPGIPEIVVQSMQNQTSAVHIMGLRLTSQIAKAHGGALVFPKRASGTYDAELILKTG